MTHDVSRDVTAPASETEANPQAPWRFSLRGTAADKAIVQRVVDAHRRMGLSISLNDAVLVLIRRAATPDADTEEEARGQIEQHWDDCPHGCDRMNIKCPEGWRLRDAYARVATRRRPPRPNPSPAPPPPLPAPVEQPEQPPAASSWRRYFGFERRAS